MQSTENEKIFYYNLSGNNRSNFKLDQKTYNKNFKRNIAQFLNVLLKKEL